MGLTSKTFSTQDQNRFIALTGDSNPLHADSIAARRTAAGAQVVHGVHTLLWLLDVIATRHADIADIAHLKVRFRKPVYLGEQLQAHIDRLSADKLSAKAVIDDVEVISLSATLGTAAAEPAGGTDGGSEDLQQQLAPCDLDLESIEGLAGRVTFATEPREMEQAFPGAARVLGARRVAALGCSSYLVGMVVPGLHSLYLGFAINATNEGKSKDELRYAVSSLDRRFRRVEIAIAGGGISGTLTAMIRPTPVAQADMQRASQFVEHREFASSTALVIGGSRGIGEVTAKLLAAGGSNVIISYATGRLDATNVAAEINRSGGRCEAIRYDINLDPQKQLQELRHVPSHVYYFPTPTILRRKRPGFAPERLEEFNKFFISGFFELIETGLRLWPQKIAAFYPSTEFVVDWPADLTEYAMSKAAAEVLCAEMSRSLTGVHVLMQRLPRVLTDQTASLDANQVQDPMPLMLPIIRKMHKLLDQN
jgi:hypothetical protein